MSSARLILAFLIAFPGVARKARAQEIETHGDASPAVGDVRTTGDASPIVIQGEGDVSITIRQGASQGWLQRELERLHESGDIATEEQSRQELDRLLQLAQLIEDRNDALASTLGAVTHKATREALSEALQRPLNAPTVSSLLDALNARTEQLLTRARTSLRQERTARYGIFAGILGAGAFIAAAYYQVQLARADNHLLYLGPSSPGYLIAYREAREAYRRSMGLSAIALSANLVASTSALHPRSASHPRAITWLLLGVGMVLSTTGLAFYSRGTFSQGIPLHTRPALFASLAFPFISAAFFHFLSRLQSIRNRNVTTADDGGTPISLGTASSDSRAPVPLGAQ